MKTLTYLSAYENALEDYHRLWRKTLRITDSVEWHHTQEITNKRYRQVDKFKQALTKRLQEQEAVDALTIHMLTDIMIMCEQTNPNLAKIEFGIVMLLDSLKGENK